MAAAIAFFVFMLHGRRGIGFVVGISVVTIVALGIVFNAHHDPSENFTRLSIWQAALAMIARFPLTGVGPFEFGPIYQLLRLPDGEPAAFHAHSFVLTVAAETGLLGVAAVLSAGGASSPSFARDSALHRCVRRSPSRSPPVWSARGCRVWSTP